MSLDATLGKGIEQMRAGEVRNKDGSSALAPSEVASPVGSLAVASVSEARRLLTRRRNRIAEILVEEGHDSDNLAVVLATYFSKHMDRPEDDEEDPDLNWGKWVMEKTNAALDRIATAVDLPNDADQPRAELAPSKSKPQ